MAGKASLMFRGLSWSRGRKLYQVTLRPLQTKPGGMFGATRPAIEVRREVDYFLPFFVVFLVVFFVAFFLAMAMSPPFDGAL